jgi:hypothetical protein
MNRQLIESICSQIYRRFPEVAGSQPKIQSRPDDHSLLVFQGKGKTADGQSITRTVRVVVDPVGKITKVTTSR